MGLFAADGCGSRIEVSIDGKLRIRERNDLRARRRGVHIAEDVELENLIPEAVPSSLQGGKA